jgi:phosphohistidine phosphatase SixA
MVAHLPLVGKAGKEMVPKESWNFGYSTIYRKHNP